MTQTSIKLKNIYVKKLSKINNKIKRKYKKIKKHPYYISLLQDNKRKYKKYIQLSKYQSKKPSVKWEHLVDIYNEISEKGFDFYNTDKIIIVKKHGKMVCIHGKHRICMLHLIHGRNTILQILNNTVVGIVSDSDGIVASDSH